MRRYSGLRYASLLAGLCMSCLMADAAEAPAAPVEVESNTLRPEQRPATQELIDQLSLPEGFAIEVFARDVGHARMLAVGEDGGVYLTCPKQNQVLSLRDADQDGAAEDVKPVFENLELVHGITLHGDALYLAGPTTLWRAQKSGEGWSEPEVIMNDLPDGGQHPNRTLGVGPDGKLYISVGSSCNACEETNPEHATLLTANLDGSARSIFAKGLRNTIGFGWHPKTSVLWGMDHGSDARGDDIPPEELNQIQEGKHYGWPFAFGEREVDPVTNPPKDMTKEEFARNTEAPVLTYQPHAAPIGMVFYTGSQFPEKYRNGAFIAFRGSWNRDPAVGYKVVFLSFDENGTPRAFEDFVTGFLIEDGRAHFGRLAGVAVTADGALLFTDDTNGMVYRVSYEGS